MTLIGSNTNYIRILEYLVVFSTCISVKLSTEGYTPLIIGLKTAESVMMSVSRVGLADFRSCITLIRLGYASNDRK